MKNKKKKKKKRLIKYRILAESEEDHNSEVSIKHFYPISRFSQKYRLLHINKFIRARECDEARRIN